MASLGAVSHRFNYINNNNNNNNNNNTQNECLSRFLCLFSRYAIREKERLETIEMIIIIILIIKITIIIIITKRRRKRKRRTSYVILTS